MTYREAIEHSLQKYNPGEGSDILPISFPSFVLNVAAIMATQIAIHNEGISGVAVGRKLAQGSFDFDSLQIGIATHGFMSDLLDQPIPEQNNQMWYDVQVLQDKLNYFAGFMNEEAESNDQ